MDKLSVLQDYFGYTGFRDGQDQLIDAVLSGRDAFGIMPTGGGKSICYQVPAVLFPGLTFVISPLIALMRDQVLALKEAGIPARAFAYPNGRRDERTDKLLFSRGIARVRGLGSDFPPNPNPHDPKGEQLDQWRPVATAEGYFLPADDFITARLVPNVIMGENYHTDIEDIMRAIARAGERGEALFIVSHGISQNAKGISMKTEWLERMLSSASDLGVIVRGIR